ncbi:peptidyl-prolyl cis-trans isomerase [Neobacillus sp. FSL H8-0543]|uniref:peptidyl-prolyl cis-trans isomerase n=1 Tax=Neobacillus sp. FSL H8-0543 TaxID=2954672 RepID=UPI003158FEE3
MEKIILITGQVKFPITLDPGVWIFDDRKIDLTTHFTAKQEQVDELLEYTKSVSKHWDREIMEGSIYPPTLKTEKKFIKEKVLFGTFAIPFKPFLDNAEPNQSANVVVIKSLNEEVEIPLDKAKDLILGFSANGKPVNNGPVHVYFGDGSNQKNPIINVREFLIR